MFAIRLKELRQKHNLSQKELACILKVSTGTVGNWEVGTREPDFDTLVKISYYFNVSCDYLLSCTRQSGETDEPTNRIPVTAVEEELINEFRKAKKRLGNNGQRAIISITKILSEI